MHNSCLAKLLKLRCFQPVPLPMALFSDREQTALKQKVPPWYAGLREAWRILAMQRYAFYLTLQNPGLEIRTGHL